MVCPPPLCPQGAILGTQCEISDLVVLPVDNISIMGLFLFPLRLQIQMQGTGPHNYPSLLAPAGTGKPPREKIGAGIERGWVVVLSVRVLWLVIL